MVTLGDILASARRSTAGFRHWLEEADPDLAEQLRATLGTDADRPHAADAAICSFARLAVADFARHASEEEWAQLTRVIRDHEDPGAACLATMVRWRLAAATCSDHSPALPVEGRR
ncbi:MAG TPA: hypothetical protein VKY54_02660 [Kiloniellales bacterium]|nr:hypothetical protein [Kiloniellales bacterium]